MTFEMTVILCYIVFNKNRWTPTGCVQRSNCRQPLFLEDNMIDMIWPMVIVVLANTFYNIFAKSTPDDVNAFLTLSVTYLCASALTFVIYLFTNHAGLVEEAGKINWTAFGFAGSIVFLELGYIFIYRAGWKVSMASLVANISLAMVLLFIGYFFYKEVISLKQLIGVFACIAGLVLMINS